MHLHSFCQQFVCSSFHQVRDVVTVRSLFVESGWICRGSFWVGMGHSLFQWIVIWFGKDKCGFTKKKKPAPEDFTNLSHVVWNYYFYEQMFKCLSGILNWLSGNTVYPQVSLKALPCCFFKKRIIIKHQTEEYSLCSTTLWDRSFYFDFDLRCLKWEKAWPFWVEENSLACWWSTNDVQSCWIWSKASPGAQLLSVMLQD